jgi:hypothetical protein
VYRSGVRWVLWIRLRDLAKLKHRRKAAPEGARLFCFSTYTYKTESDSDFAQPIAF